MTLALFFLYSFRIRCDFLGVILRLISQRCHVVLGITRAEMRLSFNIVIDRHKIFAGSILRFNNFGKFTIFLVKMLFNEIKYLIY